MPTPKAYVFSPIPPLPSAHFLADLPGAQEGLQTPSSSINRLNSESERKLIRIFTQIGRFLVYSSWRQLTVLTGLSKHTRWHTCLFNGSSSHLFSIPLGIFLFLYWIFLKNFWSTILKVPGQVLLTDLRVVILAILGLFLLILMKT